MCDKIRAATCTRRDRDFLIIARTDARAVEDLDAAIERALLYQKAGADAIFPEALQSGAEFRAFAKKVKIPLLANMTEFGKSPLLSVRQLAAMGYRMVIFPQTAFRIAMHAQEKALRELKRRGTQKPLLPQMQTREELYRLLEYDPSQAQWPARSRGKRI
jgi:methylisocitrate lyase